MYTPAVSITCPDHARPLVLARFVLDAAGRWVWDEAAARRFDGRRDPATGLPAWLHPAVRDPRRLDPAGHQTGWRIQCPRCRGRTVTARLDTLPTTLGALAAAASSISLAGLGAALSARAATQPFPADRHPAHLPTAARP